MTSTPMMDPTVARSGNAEAELRARQREIEQNRRTINAGTQKTKDEKLRESCEGFEAMFIQKMWEGMRASLPKDGMMQSRDEKHWQGMYDQELGKNMAKSGGIGLADMMMSQLSRNLQDASDVAAGSSARRRPMDIAPAPLLVEQQPAASKNPAPVVAAPVTAAPNTSASASAAQGTATASQNSDAAKSGLDMYSSAAAVAPSPEEPATDAAGATGSVAATAPTPPVSTPPEVQSALTSLATMATQAEVARGIGQQTVNHINGQQPTFPAQPGSVTQAGAGRQIPPTTSAYPQGVNPASVNTPPPELPNFTPRQPVYTAPRTTAKAPSEDVHQMARTQRQTARTSQTPRAPRTPNGLDMQTGAEFASNTASRSAAPLIGQNMPVSPVGDVATELLKSQLGEPTVKTKL